VKAIHTIYHPYFRLPHALGGSNRIEAFLEPSFTAGEAHVEGAAGEPPAGEGSRATELGLMGVSSLIALGGIGIAAFFFLTNRRAADEMAARFAGIHRLLANKYYVDEVYDAAVVTPVKIVSEDGLWKVVDARMIDGAVNGVASTLGGGSQLLRHIQTGSVRVYATSVFIGVVAILGYLLWR
jgi:NADH-quinone oxidoreductase subunit L